MIENSYNLYRENRAKVSQGRNIPAVRRFGAMAAEVLSGRVKIRRHSVWRTRKLSFGLAMD